MAEFQEVNKQKKRMTMAIKPIIFSTLMVQAILKGQKTMTRRVVTPQPPKDESEGE